MKTFIGFLKVLKSFWKIWCDYEYDGQDVKFIIDNYEKVLWNRTKTMSKPTYYANEVISEMDKWYDSVYEEQLNRDITSLMTENTMLIEKHKYLRTRCTESARDAFDNQQFGKIKIVVNSDKGE